MKRIFKQTITIEKKVKTFTFIFLSLIFLFNVRAFSQDEEKKESDDSKKPAKPAFASGQLMDDQSVVVPTKKTLEFNIQHRFGTINNGISDLAGIYAPANIRLGFSYTPINNLALGFGVTKTKQYLDFNAKYSIVKQTKDWSMPVSVSVFGNMAMNTKVKDAVIPSSVGQKYRYSYFAELIIASRITPKISLQIAPSFSHFNAMDSLYSHNMWAVSVSGRYKISPQSSLMFNYTQQLAKHKINESQNASQPNYFKLQPGVTIGWEISTSAHAFQVFASTFQGIVPQENIVFNANDPAKYQFLIGFNVTRLWSF